MVVVAAEVGTVERLAAATKLLSRALLDKVVSSRGHRLSSSRCLPPPLKHSVFERLSEVFGCFLFGYVFKAFHGVAL